MATIRDAQGQVIDLNTGEIVGRTEETPTKGRPRGPRAEQAPASISSLLNQFSAGFNTALFYVPDKVVEKVGKAAGLPEEDIPQFVNLFRGTRTDPKNAPDRFARAIGEGAGSGVFFSGILSGVARTKALAEPLTADAGVLRRVAKDTLDFIRRNPKAAIALDAGAGAAFEGVRQAVTEVAPENRLAQELVPPLAVLGAPFAAAKVAGALPSVAAGRAVREATKPIAEGDLYADIVQGGKIPGMFSFVQRAMLKRGENQITKIFGDIESSPRAQAAMREYEEELMGDPRIREAFEKSFAQFGIEGTPGLDIAQQSMDPAFLKTKALLLDKLSGDLLNKVVQRQMAEQRAFGEAAAAMTPEAERPLSQAIRSLYDENIAEQQRLADELQDTLGVEIGRVAGSFGEENTARLGSSMRNAIMSASENLFKQFQRYADRVGLRVGFDETGVPIGGRDADGNSLLPSVDINKPVAELIQRFKLKKALVPQPTPPIVQLLNKYRESKSPTDADIMEEFTKIVQAQMNATGVQRDAASLVNDLRPLIDKMMKGKALLPQETGTLKLRGISPDTIGRTYTQAVDAANANLLVDINLPEAVQLMDAAAQFRNSQMRFAQDMLTTRGITQQKADDMIKLGEQVFKDVESMLSKAFPQKIGNEWNDFQRMYKEYYSNTYEQFFPLLVSKTRPTAGGDFLLPDEDVLRRAFDNSQNMQSVVAILRPQDIAKNQDLLMRATMDWLRTKGAVTPEGLINVNRLRQIRAQNQPVLQSLPTNIRKILDDELALGENYAQRIAQLEERRAALKDEEVMSLIRKASREDADPRDLIAGALRDPANMRTLVNAMGRDPENLQSLRRAVFETAREGAEGGGSLEAFIERNQKALDILFTKEHLDDLKKLAGLQIRVFAQQDVTGRIPDFQTASQAFRSMFGVSIPGAATYYRDVQGGRVSLDGALINLMIRFASSEQERLYERMIDRALTDPDFAKAILNKRHAGKQIDKVPELNKKLGAIGVYGPSLVKYGAVRAQTLGLEEQPTEAAELPVVEPQAPAPRRPLPPAPPTAGSATAKQMLESMYFKPGLPTQAPASPAPAAPVTYDMLFPNDPLSPLLRARQQPPQNQ